jgi:ABC-2 type transport system permease protein
MIAGAYRAEVIKLVTLPAVFVTVLTAGIVSAALSVVPDADVVGYAQAGFVVLGVLAVTSEYSGGQVRTSLVSVPRRIELLTAKALALTSASVPAAAVIMTASRLVARFTTAQRAGPLTASRIVAAVAYLALVALLAAGVAALTRRTTPALVVLLGYFFVAAPLLREHAPPAGRVSAPLVAGTLVAVAAAMVTFHARDS